MTSSWARGTSEVVPAAEEAPSFDLDAAVEDAIGTFDEKDRLHNKTERTYRLPDIGVFSAYFPKTDSLATGLTIEIFDRSYRRGLFNKIKWDAVVGEQRFGLAAGWKIVPVVDITFHVFYTHDFEEKDDVWGFGFGLIKF